MSTTYQVADMMIGVRNMIEAADLRQGDQVLLLADTRSDKTTMEALTAGLRFFGAEPMTLVTAQHGGERGAGRGAEMKVAGAELHAVQSFAVIHCCQVGSQRIFYANNFSCGNHVANFLGQFPKDFVGKLCVVTGQQSGIAFEVNMVGFHSLFA